MTKFGMPESRKPVHAWFDEVDREVIRKLALAEARKKEIDTTSEIRRREKPEDLDVLGWKSL